MINFITNQEMSKQLKSKKGIDFSVKTVAMVALGIMVVVLIYTMFDTWFTEIGNNFVGNVQFPSPQN